MLLATSLDAQTVRGTLTDVGGTSVAGMHVTLVDASGRATAGALTDVSGAFSLRAPQPGRFRLRAERVGYATTTVGPFDLAAGQTLDYRMSVLSQKTQLQLITVRGRSRCSVRPGTGAQTAALWDEVRKALAATALTEKNGGYRSTARRYVRRLDPATLRIRHEEFHVDAGYSAKAFVSVPAERLARVGFMERVGDTTLYHAPDAETVLSDEFLDAHCFRIVAGPEEAPELIGLAFVPVRDRRVSGIEGTLWVDRASAELRYLEYRYPDLAFDGPTEHIGGRIDFQRLPNGAWVVSRWYIRMPELALREIAFGAGNRTARLRVSGLTEEGGEVTEVVDRSGRLVHRSGTATIAGTVWDSIAGAPLAGAVVKLRGTAHADTTDEQGLWALIGLPPGRYTVGVEHPKLIALGVGGITVEAELRSDERAALALATPGANRVRAALCSQPGDTAGLMFGRVTDSEMGSPVAGAEVRLEWKEGYTRPLASGPVRESRASRATQTDSEGYYALCGVPYGAELEARVRVAQRGSVVRPVRRAARPVEREDFGISVRTSSVAGDTPPGPANRTVVLDPIVAQGQRRTALEAEARRSGWRQSALVGDELNARIRAARHVGDVVRRFPSLSVTEIMYTNAPGMIKQVCIRPGAASGRLRPGGDCPNMVSVYLDDMPLSNPGEFLRDLPPTQLERVEYIAGGAAGTRLGTGSANGVLLLYTKGRASANPDSP